MTYKRFEDLPVWKQAIVLAQGVYDMTESGEWKASASLRDQIERAALSVSNNIAEGFERGTTNELLYFIYVARGSAGEVRSMLCFLELRPKLVSLKSRISNLKSIAESCSRQLRGWADHLQNCEIQGQRHLNRESRKGYERRRAVDEFEKQLQDLLPPGHPGKRR